METINVEDTGSTALKEDRQMLMIMHLSQLLVLVSGIGGIVVPIILWQLKKDEIQDMDAQGKEVVNFQISLFIYYIIAGILCIVLIGFILIPIIILLNIIFPIIYGLKAKDGVKDIKYPMTIRFIK